MSVPKARIVTAAAALTALWTAQVPAAEPAAPAFFSEKERLPLPSLQGLSRLRFVTTVDFPPFNALDGAGRLGGYNVDLARALCRQLGLDAICQIEAVPWNELTARLLSGDADAIVAGLQPTDDNRTELAFTRSYLRLPARFATRRDKGFSGPAATAVKDRPVGVIARTAHEQLLKAYFPQARAVPYPDRDAMLADLAGGKIDAVFDDGMRLSFWLDGDKGSCCAFADGPYLAPQYLGSGLSIAVARKNATLQAALDNALHALQQNGTLTELYLRYFPTSFY